MPFVPFSCHEKSEDNLFYIFYDKKRPKPYDISRFLTIGQE